MPFQRDSNADAYSNSTFDTHLHTDTYGDFNCHTNGDCYRYTNGNGNGNGNRYGYTHSYCYGDGHGDAGGHRNCSGGSRRFDDI